MKRRGFIKSSVGAGVAAVAAASLGSFEKALGSAPVPVNSDYDIVAVKGGEPAAMFDLGIQAMGGMGAFVSKGQRVVIKPNIGWDVVPEKAANTNPELVKRIIEHCIKAGASEVLVFDHTCDNWVKCYKSSGIEKAAKDAGAKVVPADSESYYKQVNIPNGKRLTSAKVHELIINSDVFINVPVLKNHGGAIMTGALKNMMGVVWDRGYWHKNDLNQCIADYALYPKKPALHVLDAYRVMTKNGPRGVSVDDVTFMQSLLLSTDWVAIDAAGAKMLNLEPSAVKYITLAAEMGLGKCDLSKLNINRIKI
ncbi:MAG TPA: DUF362 domain-containing protein [Bacteroidales bacterium]|nr:DUF362 domain-containing protein [Bacteroidales bacterium]HPT11831.1 DUF362 domain-containing protein [Bacteroidales bacterium]